MATHHRRVGIAVTQCTQRMPVAALAPLLCAVHCIATPLLVASIPALAGGAVFEVGAFGLSLVLATWSVIGGIRHHGDWQVAAPVGAGLAAWAVLLHDPSVTRHAEVLQAVAAGLVAAGLLWNARRRHHATSTGPCPACAGDHGG